MTETARTDVGTSVRSSTAQAARRWAAGLASAVRPAQWPKNLLVLAAPGAAGLLGQPAVARDALVAAACFVAVSSGVYLLNDVVDRHEDAAHPAKRDRPIAAGRVPPGVALAVAAVLAASGLGLAAVATTRGAAVVLAVYLGLNLAYDLGLRRVPLVDLAVVAGGFVLRAVAGGAATGVQLSKWFVIVISFAALYVVICKRTAELRTVRGSPARGRAVLDAYSPSLLRDLRVSTAAVAVGAYVLWAFESARFVGEGSVFYELSIIPFVLALYRYAMVVDGGGGGAPEQVFAVDRPLQAFTAAWLVVFALGVYVG